MPDSRSSRVSLRWPLRVWETARNQAVRSFRWLIGWPAERWIALSSAVVAAAALGLAVWQGYLDREFRKRELQPHVRVSYFYNDEGSGFVMSNRGFGPARVEWSVLQIDGESSESWLDAGFKLSLPGPPAFEYVIPSGVFDRGSQTKIFWLPRSNT